MKMEIKEISQEILSQFIKTSSKMEGKHYSKKTLQQLELFLFLMCCFWGRIDIIKAFLTKGILDNENNKNCIISNATFAANVGKNQDTIEYLLRLGLKPNLSAGDSGDRIEVEMGYRAIADYLDVSIAYYTTN